MGVNYKLKEIRGRKGLSQEKLAAAVGMTYLSYNLKENGKRKFTELEIKNISEFLEVDVNDIFFN